MSKIRQNKMEIKKGDGENGRRRRLSARYKMEYRAGYWDKTSTIKRKKGREFRWVLEAITLDLFNFFFFFLRFIRISLRIAKIVQLLFQVSNLSPGITYREIDKSYKGRANNF